ncbi:MAG TPA: acyl-CoA dehydrogenase C-terminal domain-containing protein, partial [Phenylobacterium sp.]|nr:acyl-CoA dehydrogenase C-terminal domain-containing protein [Phenylobacterium sp.]
GYMWALAAKTAQEKIAGGAADPIYPEKLTLGRYYMARILPETTGHLAKLKSGAELMMALPAEAF